MAAVLLTAAIPAAQTLQPHTLTGTVTGPAGRALPGATVELSRPAESGTVRSVSTDEEGRYRIERLLPGDYVLAVRLAGYAPAIRELEVGGGPLIFEYDVELSPASPSGPRDAPSSQPTKRVVCGMTVISPPADFDKGIQGPKSQPPRGAPQVKPTIRAVQPALCWEPSSASPPVPPTR
jgi:hypothetical protein